MIHSYSTIQLIITPNSFISVCFDYLVLNSKKSIKFDFKAESLFSMSLMDLGIFFKQTILERALLPLQHKDVIYLKMTLSLSIVDKDVFNQLKYTDSTYVILLDKDCRGYCMEGTLTNSCAIQFAVQTENSTTPLFRYLYGVPCELSDASLDYDMSILHRMANSNLNNSFAINTAGINSNQQTVANSDMDPQSFGLVSSLFWASPTATQASIKPKFEDPRPQNTLLRWVITAVELLYAGGMVIDLRTHKINLKSIVKKNKQETPVIIYAAFRAIKEIKPQRVRKKAKSKPKKN